MGAVRWCAGVLGAAVVFGSVLGLAAPVSLYAVDRSGERIACGSVLKPDYETAAREDAVNQRLHETRGSLFQRTSYTDDCAALIGGRRSVGLPAVALGSAAVLAALAGGLYRPVRSLVQQLRRRGSTAPARRIPARLTPPTPGDTEAGLVEEAVGAINRRAMRPG